MKKFIFWWSPYLSVFEPLNKNPPKQVHAIWVAHHPPPSSEISPADTWKMWWLYLKNVYNKYLQNLKYKRAYIFCLNLVDIPSILILSVKNRRCEGVLLNGQNPLDVATVICWQSLSRSNLHMCQNLIYMSSFIHKVIFCLANVFSSEMFGCHWDHSIPNCARFLRLGHDPSQNLMRICQVLTICKIW